MTKRMLAIGVLVVCLTLGFRTGAHADFIAKTSSVHTSTGGATLALDVDLINGDTSLGALFINNVSTNSVPFAGTASAVAVGSNLLASYGVRAGGGTGAVYNPSGGPSQPIVAVFALSGTVAAGGGNVFVATGGRVGFFSIVGTLASNGYNQFSPATGVRRMPQGRRSCRPLRSGTSSPRRLCPTQVTYLAGAVRAFSTLTPWTSTRFPSISW